VMGEAPAASGTEFITNDRPSGDQNGVDPRSVPRQRASRR
jgi:hypothetical protein